MDTMILEIWHGLNMRMASMTIECLTTRVMFTNHQTATIANMAAGGRLIESRNGNMNTTKKEILCQKPLLKMVVGLRMVWEWNVEKGHTA